MHHQAHVLFVDAHAEGVSGDDRLDLARDERILIGAFFGRIHAPGKRDGFQTVGGESRGKFLGFPHGGNVDNSRTLGGLEEFSQTRVAIRVVFNVNDAVAQVLAFGRRRKDAQFQSESLLEVVADVLNNFLFGRGGKAGNGNFAVCTVKIFQLFDEVRDEKIVDAEIVPPDREAVRFIDYKACHAALLQCGKNGAGTQ